MSSLPSGLRGRSAYVAPRIIIAVRQADRFTLQGFDEFMNLVIDDAVEVRLATKTEEEKRRPLGTHETATVPESS